MFFLHRKSIVVGPGRSEPIVVGPSSPVVVGPGPAALVIGPQPRGAWDEQGWIRLRQNNQEVFQGFFLAASRNTRQQFRFEGRIVARQGEFLTYIANPPEGIQRHPKGPCFSAETPPWFRLHWHHAPKNVDDAILYMEKILSEALN